MPKEVSTVAADRGMDELGFLGAGLRRGQELGLGFWAHLRDMGGDFWNRGDLELGFPSLGKWEEAASALESIFLSLSFLFRRPFR